MATTKILNNFLTIDSISVIFSGRKESRIRKCNGVVVLPDSFLGRGRGELNSRATLQDQLQIYVIVCWKKT